METLKIKFLTENKLKAKKLIFVCGFNNYLGINEEYDTVNRTMYFNNLEDVKQYADEIDAENFITKFETNTIKKFTKIEEIERNGTYSWGSEAEAYLVAKDYKYLLETVPTFIEFIEREIK